MTVVRAFRISSMLLAVSAAALQAQAPAAPPAPTDSLSGSASLGLSMTSGNSRASSYNVSDKLKYTKRGWTIGQDLVFYYGKADDKVNADFWNAGLRLERRLTPWLGMFAATRYDRNVLQGIESRFEESLGFDMKALDNPKDKLVMTVGASAFQQTLTPGSTSTFKGNYPAARLGADYKHSFTDKAFFQQTVEYLPNLSETEAYLVNGESSLVAPLIANLGLKVGYVVRYNSQPPVRDNVALKNTDRFLSSSITYSF